jgi:hypothetical protein
MISFATLNLYLQYNNIRASEACKIQKTAFGKYPYSKFRYTVSPCFLFRNEISEGDIMSSQGDSGMETICKLKDVGGYVKMTGFYDSRGEPSVSQSLYRKDL